MHKLFVVVLLFKLSQGCKVWFPHILVTIISVHGPSTAFDGLVTSIIFFMKSIIAQSYRSSITCYGRSFNHVGIPCIACYGRSFDLYRVFILLHFKVIRDLILGPFALFIGLGIT